MTIKLPFAVVNELSVVGTVSVVAKRVVVMATELMVAVVTELLLGNGVVVTATVVRTAVIHAVIN